MSNEEIKYIWSRMFGKAPDDEIIELMGSYTRQGEEHERILMWLVVMSTSRLFRLESERAVWIGEQLLAHQKGVALPRFNEPAPAV